MDISKAFSFVFKDPDWLSKILVGSIILVTSLALTPVLIGLVGFLLVTGYMLEVLRNVRMGLSDPLPPWQDRWGDWIVWGLKLWVVVLIWALPGMIVLTPGVLGGALAESNEAWGGLLAFCFGCLSLLWWAVLAAVQPALYIRMAETKELTSGFQFGEIFRFTLDNIGAIVIAVLVVIVAGLIFGLLGWIAGLLLCFVGLIVTVPASWLITGLIQVHLFAQIGPDDGDSGTGVAELDALDPPSFDEAVVIVEDPAWPDDQVPA